MDNLYSYILDSLRKLSQTQNNEAAFKSYLQSLQPSVKQLRKAYVGNQVVVDYSEPNIAFPSLLRYSNSSE